MDDEEITIAGRIALLICVIAIHLGDSEDVIGIRMVFGTLATILHAGIFFGKCFPLDGEESDVFAQLFYGFMFLISVICLIKAC